MTHTVDKSRVVEGFLVEYLAEEIGDLAFVLPVLDILLYALEHLTDLDIRTAVLGSFERTYSRRVCRIRVCSRGGQDAAGKCRVITAAVLCVEHKHNVEQFCLLIGELSVGTERRKYHLCSRMTLYKRVHYHALVVVGAALYLISGYHNVREL